MIHMFKISNRLFAALFQVHVLKIKLKIMMYKSDNFLCITEIHLYVINKIGTLVIFIIDR